MQELPKDEMKKIMEGVMPSSDGGCQANAACTITKGSTTYLHPCVEKDAGELGCICICSKAGGFRCN